MIETLVLPSALREQLEREAKAAFPRECCGLVEGVREGSSARATALHAMPNLAGHPDRFEIDPAAQIALLRSLRGTGREIVGCYHSHPRGHPDPSPRDMAGAAETGFIWLIAALESSTGALRLACFIWRGTVFAPVQLIPSRPRGGAEGDTAPPPCLDPIAPPPV